jgi:GNAT superfamily N-acetyltransferase
MKMRFAICPINETLTASAFELATEVFVRHSHLHKAVGADLRSYRAYVAAGFFRDVADGLSLMAVDRTDNNVIGVLIVRDFISPAPPQLDDPQYAPIAAVTSHLESIYRRQRQISAGEVALVDMAAVHPDYAGQGVYRALRMALATHGFARGYRYIAGELSSAVTQRLVLDHLQHRNCAELVLADFIYESKRPFAAIKTPPKIILAEGPTTPPSA